MKHLAGRSFTGILTTIFIFLLPFVTSSSLFYGQINLKYFLVILFAAILGVFYSWKVFQKDVQINFKNRKLLGILLLTVAAYYISALVGVDFDRSLNSDIARSTGLLFLTATGLVSVFLSDLLNREDWSIVFQTIIASTGLLSIWSIFAPNLNLSFGNTTFVGAYVLIGFILSLNEFVKSESGSKAKKILGTIVLIHLLSPLLVKWSVLFNFGAFLQNPVSILGSARASGATAIIALLFALGVIWFKKANNKKLLVYWTTLFFVVSFGSVALLFTPGSFIQEKYIESSTAARVIVWESSIEAFKERPFFGWGPENFRYAQHKYFSPDLYLDKNIGEIWFDKPHNFFVEKLVTVGVVGLTLVLIVLVYIFKVLYQSVKNGAIKRGEGIMLGSLFLFHILQLQTSFDTPATYALIALVVGYVLWLEKNNAEETKVLGPNKQKLLAIVLTVVIVMNFFPMFVGEWSRQKSLSKLFFDAPENRVEVINKALSQSDFEILRLSSSSFIKGLIVQLESVNPNDVANLIEAAKPELDAYDFHYKEYLEKTPHDYRVRMNYAYLLFVKTFLGENRLDEAKELIAGSYELSNNNPLTPIMDGLAHFYGGDLKTAREKINEAIAINPEIEFSNEVSDYLDRQAARIPNVAIIRLENL